MSVFSEKFIGIFEKFVLTNFFQAVGFEKFSVFRPSILVTTGARYGFKDQMFQGVAPKFTGILATK